MAYFEKTLHTLKQVAEATKEIRKGGVHAGATQGQAPKLDPHAVVEALAEGMKNDNASTQAVAGRANALATKYSQRAY